VANEFQQIAKKIKEVIHSDQVMRTSLTTVLSVHKPRIFQKGQDANQSKIGNYSTKPISISKSRQARNTGKTYFPGGYAQYKSETGKGGTVNFRDTDQMMMDYGLVVSGDKYGFGFQNEFNFNKSQWLQDKFDKDVFDLSNQERDLLSRTLKTQIESKL
jgi:hypothetical protein